MYSLTQKPKQTHNLINTTQDTYKVNDAIKCGKIVCLHLSIEVERVCLKISPRVFSLPRKRHQSKIGNTSNYYVNVTI